MQQWVGVGKAGSGSLIEHQNVDAEHAYSHSLSRTDSNGESRHPRLQHQLSLATNVFPTVRLGRHDRIEHQRRSEHHRQLVEHHLSVPLQRAVEDE